MVEQDMIDITPFDGGTGHKGLKNTVFQETEWKHILNNPRNLTKEGIEETINIWANSQNRHVELKFRAMKQRCKQVAESGHTPDGRIILSRDADGVPKWTKEDPDYKPPVKSKESKDKKDK